MSRPLGPGRRALTTLRIAAKQLRRNPRRARLIVALVALPSTVLMMVGTVYASQNPTADELILSELGQAQAWVRAIEPDGVKVFADAGTARYQVVDGDGATSEEFADVPTLLPADTALLALDQVPIVVNSGERAGKFGAISGRSWDPALAGKFRIVEGAVPTEPGEVMLSPAASALLDVGVGDTVAVGRPSHDVVVVGILEARHGDESGTVFGLPEDVGTAESPFDRTWYLTESDLTREQVEALGNHGVIAFSRTAAESTRGRGAVGSGTSAFTNALQNSGISATMGIGAFEMILLAGAGFMVSMRGDQRRLALLAATGAPRSSLLGTGVATGVWLGLVGGVVGVVVGVGLGLAWTWWQLHHAGQRGAESVWGYHVVPEHAVGTVLFAVAVSALSAWVPAILASRLDVVAALRGSRRPTPTKTWPTIVGLGFASASVALFLWAANVHEHAWDVARGAADGERSRASTITVAAVVVGLTGAALAAPLLLRGLAHLAAPWGIAARIGARDAARHTFRTVPVVAAIAVTVVVATLGAVSAEKEVRLRSAERAVEHGDGFVQLPHMSAERPEATYLSAMTDAIVTAVPDASAVVVETVEEQYGDATGPRVATLVMPEAERCGAGNDGAATTEREYAQDPRCDRPGDAGTFASGIVVGGPEQLRAILGREPSAEELAVLDAGGAVVFAPFYVEGGVATIASWDYAAGNFPDAATPPAGSVSLDAVVAAPERSLDQGFTAVVTPETAAQFDAVWLPYSIVVARDGGLSEVQQSEIQRELFQVGEHWLQVSRPQDNYALQYAMLSLGLVLVIGGVCTAIALALARQEAAYDDATLASLGAAPTLTKSIAAWHAGIVVFLAVAVGVALGLGTAWAGMRDVATGMLFAPWVWLAAAVVAVPVVFGLLAWVFTKAPKVIHYRLAA